MKKIMFEFKNNFVLFCCLFITLYISFKFLFLIPYIIVFALILFLIKNLLKTFNIDKKTIKDKITNLSDNFFENNYLLIKPETKIDKNGYEWVVLNVDDTNIITVTNDIFNSTSSFHYLVFFY